MRTAYPLPDLDKVQKILGMLFDGLGTSVGGTFNDGPESGSWIGVYVADTGKPVALCGADARLAASMGAALSLMPLSASREAGDTHEMYGVMYENLCEIMNICTRLVLDATSPHLKLHHVYPIDSLPVEAGALLTGARGRCEFQLNLPRYGGGVLSLLSV
jgi:hypothetical protein